MFDLEKAESFIQKQTQIYPLFEYYRIVDVDTYEVYEWKKSRLMATGEPCYQVWSRNCACRNCVSRLAVDENRSIIKMETIQDRRIFLIESVPLKELGDHYALELIKEVTDNLLFADHDQKDNVMLTEIIYKMNELSTRDSYTGLYNKRFMEHELKREISEWKEERPLTMALLDIDQFKTVNDNYGHLVGDRVILALSDALKECAESHNGWACRIGGDEFLILFRGLKEAQAQQVIQNFRSEIAQISFGDMATDYQISVSAGLAEYDLKFQDWETWFTLADQAMYENKMRAEIGSCPSRITLCSDHATMLKKEKQTVLTKEEYLKNPCRTSAIPYWKYINYELPAGVEVIHEEEIGKIDIDKRRQAARYFRLFHCLDLRTSLVESKVELQIAPKQIADFAVIINAAYEDLQVSETQLKQLQKHSSYDPKGWVLAKDKQTGLPLACGIAALDKEMQEISLEWIQVLPQVRGLGIGRDLVIQLLLNLRDQARFATVSGKVDGPRSPENFYRKCGFTGKDVWYIVRK